jgi:adenylate cyclase
MCTEFTMEPAKELVEFRELDKVAVKGVTVPVRVFEMIGEKGKVPEEILKGIAYFQKGLELYRKRQFEEATKYFNAVFKFIPNDGPAKEFIERSNGYMKNPPPEGWDGSFHATEK